MDIPDDHKTYLRLTAYILGCSSIVFPDDEFRVLTTHGCWMEALASGAIQPITDQQRQFLRVCRGEVEPETVYERAWIRMIGRREFERENRNSKSRSEPAEDYGIPDWDLDRWW